MNVLVTAVRKLFWRGLDEAVIADCLGLDVDEVRAMLFVAVPGGAAA